MHSKTSKTRIIAAERRIEALKLRRAGLSFEQIAQHLGISTARAYKLVSEELAKIRQCLSQETEGVRLLELERLDDLFRQSYSAAISGDLKGVDSCLRIMQRRAAMCGLDSPNKIEVSEMLVSSPEWASMKSKIISVLQKYPQALEDLRHELGKEEMEEP